MIKMLITGGSGLLGSNIAKLAKSKFNVYATYYQNEVKMDGIHFFQIDLTKKEEYMILENINPDIIIHCAALTDVDFCEDNPNVAYEQNVVSSRNIAIMAKKMGSYLIHVSTDSIFDGKKGNYTENDLPNPINIYGKTKLKAEEEVFSIIPEACVVRTNIYGWNKRKKFSLAEWMISNLQSEKNLFGLKDVYFAPIFVNDLIEKLFILYEINFQGLIHLGSSECLSKLDFAYKIANVFGFNKSLIKPITLNKLKLNASRPKKTCLDVSKAEKFLNGSMPTAKDGLIHMKKLLDQGYVKELKYG